MHTVRMCFLGFLDGAFLARRGRGQRPHYSKSAVSVFASPARMGGESGGSETGAVVRGWDAVEFLEEAAEVELVGKAQALRDLLDLEFRADDQLKRFLV